ncbi:MAG: hypothetical protein ACRC37_01345 [Lentisphaeria bacterium]
MIKFNIKVLPPILENAYTTFKISQTQNSTIEIEPKLSAVNFLNQVDHAQIKLVSLDTNKNAFSKTVVPRGIYFLDLKGVENLQLKINTFLNGKSIFSDFNPQYYRLQVRFGVAGNAGGNLIYNSSMGQNPPDDFTIASENLSEWSNSAIIKSAELPSFGFVIPDLFKFNEAKGGYVVPNPWTSWMGYYDTRDLNESLEWYQFKIKLNGTTFEEGPQTYIKEYEIPVINFKGKKTLENKKLYELELTTRSQSGFENSISVFIYPDYKNVRLFSISGVEEDEDRAVNRIDVNARQVILLGEKYVYDEIYLEDETSHNLGDSGPTHLKLEKRVYEPVGFSIQDNSFCLMLTCGNFLNLVQPRMAPALLRENAIFILGPDKTGSGTEYRICAHKENNQTVFTLIEEILSGGVYRIRNLYKINYGKNIVKNEEIYFQIKKIEGETTFEAKKYITNNFVEGVQQ